MKTYSKKTWKNWSGSISCVAGKIYYPETQEDIVTAIRECKEKQQRLRVAGNGHSFSPLIKTNDNILSLKRYSGIESIDKEKNEATVRAGMRLRTLGQSLAEHGLAMENLGDIDCQSVAGALATGTHGTGINFGNIATQIVGLTLITADGEILECSAEQNPEIFKAAQISLGALGIISKIKLRLVPMYYLKVRKQQENLEDCLKNLDKSVRENRNYEFFWFPHTDFVYTKSCNITEEKRKSSLVRKFIDDAILENFGLWAIGIGSRFFPFTTPLANKILKKWIPDGEEADESYCIFKTYRWVRFHEMEYAVPLEKGVEVFSKIREWIVENKIKVRFPMEFRVAAGDDIYLSPTYGRKTVYIAIHTFLKVPHKKLFEGCEKIFGEYQGRPHWGKMHYLKAKQLRKIYPKWDEFHAVRKQLDPQGMFLNDYLQDLFIETDSDKV